MGNDLLMEQLIDRVAEKTSGSASDPLTREDVEKVVLATCGEMASDDVYKTLIGDHY